MAHDCRFPLFAHIPVLLKYAVKFADFMTCYMMGWN